MNQVEVNQEKMSDQQVDAIGKTLATVIMGFLAAMFAYAYLTHLLLH